MFALIFIIAFVIGFFATMFALDGSSKAAVIVLVCLMIMTGCITIGIKDIQDRKITKLGTGKVLSVNSSKSGTTSFVKREDKTYRCSGMVPTASEVIVYETYYPYSGEVIYFVQSE